MNKIIKSLSVIAFVAIVAAGATSAVFTSSVESNNNTFAAGTLTLEKNGSETIQTGADNMKPGDSKTLTIPVKNTGTLPLTYSTVVTTDAGTPNSLFTAQPDTDLYPAVAVVTDGAGSLNPEETGEIVITVTLPLDAGNAYQGDSGIVNVTVSAE